MDACSRGRRPQRCCVLRCAAPPSGFRWLSRSSIALPGSLATFSPACSLGSDAGGGSPAPCAQPPSAQRQGLAGALGIRLGGGALIRQVRGPGGWRAACSGRWWRFPQARWRSAACPRALRHAAPVCLRLHSHPVAAGAARCSAAGRRRRAACGIHAAATAAAAAPRQQLAALRTRTRRRSPHAAPSLIKLSGTSYRSWLSTP